MERNKLLQEHEELVNVLLEKTKYIYSEDFYNLDEFEKQKYIKDKMATEGHLSTLSNLLWCKVPQLGGLSDLFALSLIGSMFGNSPWGNSSSNFDLMKKELENAKVEEVKDVE